MPAHTNENHDASNDYSKTVLAAFELLQMFDAETTELGIRELSRKLGKPKSSVSRLVSTLNYLGVLEQDPVTEKYHIGFKLLELGSLWLQNVPLRDRIHRYLSKLVDETQETAYLAILSRDNTAIYIDKVQSPQAVRVGSPVGRAVPLRDSAIGRALLAYLPAEQQKQIIQTCKPVKQTPNTICDPAELEQFLALSVKRGYFLDDEEIEIGLRCVAVPILRDDGSPIASVCTSGPSTRITLERVPDIAHTVQRIAAEASKELTHLEKHDGILLYGSAGARRQKCPGRS